MTRKKTMIISTNTMLSIPTEPPVDLDDENLKQQERVQKKLEEFRKRDPFIYR